MIFPGIAFHAVVIRQREIGLATWPLYGDNQGWDRMKVGYARRTVDRNVTGLK